MISTPDTMLWGASRAFIPGPIAPGAIATFEFEIRTPPGPVWWDMEWRMVQDNVEWFGDWTNRLPVTIPGRTMSVRVAPYPVPVNRLITATIFATDSTGAPVAGAAELETPPALPRPFPTNQPFQFTFVRKLVGRPGERDWQVTRARVRAPGFNPTAADLGIPEPL